MKIYAFDVDETLDFSGGPITVDMLVELRQDNILWLCGNWAMVTRCPNWYKLFSFVGPIGGVSKEEHLIQIKRYIPADDHIMVGNILNVTGLSDDKGAAERSGWRFISETEFARGTR